MTRVASCLTLRPPRNPVCGLSAGLGVVRGGYAVGASHTPTSAGLCSIGARPRCNALYPRTPIPTIARRVGRPCFHSHAMALSFLTPPYSNIVTRQTPARPGGYAPGGGHVGVPAPGRCQG